MNSNTKKTGINILPNENTFKISSYSCLSPNLKKGKKWYFQIKTTTESLGSLLRNGELCTLNCLKRVHVHSFFFTI